MSRYTVSLGVNLENKLDKLSKAQESNKAEVLKRCIAIYSFLWDETSEGKKRVAIIDKDSNEKEYISLI
jgi:hypothetical protein